MKRLLWIGMLLLTLTVRAQFDAAFTNTWALQSYYNPAAAGLDSKLNVQGAYSLQMVGFEGAPKTMVINADMPLFFIGPKHGVGAAFLNDAIGAFTNKKIQLQYAFHQKLFGGRVSAGIRPALLMVGFNGSTSMTVATLLSHKTTSKATPSTSTSVCATHTRNSGTSASAQHICSVPP